MRLRGKQSSSTLDPGAVPRRIPIRPYSVRRNVQISAFIGYWSSVLTIDFDFQADSPFLSTSGNSEPACADW